MYYCLIYGDNNSTDRAKTHLLNGSRHLLLNKNIMKLVCSANPMS